MSQETLQILTCFNILDCDQCCHLHAISNAYGKIWACRGTAIGQFADKNKCNGKYKNDDTWPN